MPMTTTRGDLTGERALQQLLALPGGSFELVPFEPPPQNTISGAWESLLMEAARVRDELASLTPPGEPEIDPLTLTAPAVAPTRVVELLICSDTLPLGTFDRVELQLSAGRAIALIRSGRMVFVRVTRETTGS